jgi:thioesterase domain-containing protein
MTDRWTSSTDAPREAVPWLLTANTSGPLPPIVFLHTWGDDEPAQFDALGPAVGPTQPLYAIEPPDAAALAGFDRVADWVAYERGRLDELPVRPPYRLAGWSFGGVVALELARCLSAEGIAVMTVDLIDTWLPRNVPRTARERLQTRFRTLRSLPKPQRRRYAWETAQRFPRAATRFGLEKTRHVASRFRPRVDTDQQNVDPRYRAIWVPYVKYRPTAYPHSVTIYSCDESVERNWGDGTLGWSRWLVGGSEVVHLPGTHKSLWDAQHITVLADALTT